MEAIKLWWGGQSKTAKGLYITGAVALLATVTYFVVNGRKNKTASANKKAEGGKDIPDTNNTDTSKEKGAEDTQSSKEEVSFDKSKLPNGGVGCTELRTTYDRDFDYVKCDNIWYTKSKDNAASPYAKGLYKDWKSLANNAVATERLSRRYPKG